MSTIYAISQQKQTEPYRHDSIIAKLLWWHLALELDMHHQVLNRPHAQVLYNGNLDLQKLVKSD